MIGIVQDPQDPNKLVLTATVTIYLDRLLSDVLGEEVSKAIREIGFSRFAALTCCEEGDCNSRTEVAA